MRSLMRLFTLIIKVKSKNKKQKKNGCSFIVELHLLIGGHNPGLKNKNQVWQFFFVCVINFKSFSFAGVCYGSKISRLCSFSLTFPFSPNLITGFSALEMVHSPKIFSKNLFEILINLIQVPSAARCTW